MVSFKNSSKTTLWKNTKYIYIYIQWLAEKFVLLEVSKTYDT